MKSNKSTILSSSILSKSTSRPNVAAITILILSLICSASLILYSEQRLLELERARVSDLAGDHAHLLQTSIERVLSATFSLAALVREGKGNISNFETTAKEMLPFFPGASSLQLAPEGVVRYIVPLAGNEEAIGHDLFKDPQRRKEAIKTRDDGKLTLAGPFALKQGGFGALGRMPVYLDSKTGGRKFWGFTNVLIRFPEVLAPARLASLEKRGFSYELWRLHPDSGERQIIAASSSTPLINAVDHTLKLPNGTWTLSVVPSTGWVDLGGIALKSVLGLVFSILFTFLTYSLLNTRTKALQLAQKLTSELYKSEERYRSLIYKVQTAIMLHDNQGNILISNPLAQRLLGLTEDQILGKTLIDPELHFLREDGSIMTIPEYPVSRVLSTRQALRDYVMGIRRSDKDDVTWTLVNAEPENNDAGEITLVIVSFVDITERKQADEVLRRLNRELRAISNCSQVLVRAEDEQALLNEICRIICDEADYRLAWVGYAENDEAKSICPVAWSGFDSEYVAHAKLSWADDTEWGRGPGGTAIRSGEIVYIHDFIRDSRMAPWLEGALKRGYSSVIGFPLKDTTAHVFGVLLIYSTVINAFTTDEIRLLDELANDMAFGISALRNHSERKRTEVELKEQMYEINKFNKLMIGREEKMIELKKEINNLLEKEGKPKKYDKPI